MKYEERYLEPLCSQGQKSFYGKARVRTYADGTEELISYTTVVMKKDASGNYARTWDGWSATTGRHVYAYAGINKKQWDEMEVRA